MQSRTYLALFYEVVSDYLERRGEYRADHLKLANEAHDRGELAMAGAFSDPADSALLVWRTDDRTIVEKFVEHDPYVQNGLVARWWIRSWTVVID